MDPAAQLPVGGRSRPCLSLLKAWYEADCPWSLAFAPLPWPKEQKSFHPQGLVKRGDFIYLSTVEKEGRGNPEHQNGYIYQARLDEGLQRLVPVAQTRLKVHVPGSTECEYHPGGLDYSEPLEAIVLSLAQYKGNSTTTFFSIDPSTLESREIFSDSDHYGSVICANDLILATNWHSESIRRISSEERDTLGRMPRSYQDCKFVHLEKHMDKTKVFALCGGLNRIPTPHWSSAWRWPEFYRDGYLDLVEICFNDSFQESEILLIGSKKVDVVDQIPMTHNTMAVEQININSQKAKLRFYFAPHDYPNTRLFIFETPEFSLPEKS